MPQATALAARYIYAMSRGSLGKEQLGRLLLLRLLLLLLLLALWAYGYMANVNLELPAAILSGNGVPLQEIGAFATVLERAYRDPERFSTTVGDNGPNYLAYGLWSASGLTLVFTVGTVVYRPARAAGHIFRNNETLYYCVLMIILMSTVAEALTAIWLSREPYVYTRRRSSFARAMMCFAIGPLALIVAITCFRFIEN